jgi:(2Fe-2S) ferredoxin
LLKFQKNQDIFSNMTGYKNHLFICTNAPDKEGKCGSKGSEALRQDIKKTCQQAFGKEVRVNASGCLGYCEQGIAAVLYPSGKWLLGLKDTDQNTILDLIQSHQAISETNK